MWPIDFWPEYWAEDYWPKEGFVPPAASEGVGDTRIGIGHKRTFTQEPILGGGGSFG